MQWEVIGKQTQICTSYFYYRLRERELQTKSLKGRNEELGHSVAEKQFQVKSLIWENAINNIHKYLRLKLIENCKKYY